MKDMQEKCGTVCKTGRPKSDIQEKCARWCLEVGQTQAEAPHKFEQLEALYQFL